MSFFGIDIPACFACENTSKSLNSAPRNGSTGKGGAKCGVGITFTSTARDELIVKSLDVGGPAHKSGMVKAGDQLMEVSGVDVRPLLPKEIGSMLLGEEGTGLDLSFVRKGHPELIRVKLERRVRRVESEMNSPSPSAKS